MFVIKYVEFLLSDESVANVNAQKIKYFHHKLVCELYYHGLQKYEDYAEIDRKE